MTPKEMQIVSRAKNKNGQNLLSDFEKDFIKTVDQWYQYKDLSDKQKVIMNGIWRKVCPEEAKDAKG